MNLPTNSPALIRGSGKGGGEPQAPKEDPNDLRSKSYVRVLDLLGWGQWKGLKRKTPGTTKTCDIEKDNPHIGTGNVTGLVVGQTVEGPGIQTGTTIQSIDVSGTFVTVAPLPYQTANGVTCYFGSSTGAESIYFDETPLVNADGTSNFSGIKYAITPGTQDQGYISGFDTIENYVSVGIKVRNVAPVIRTITNSDADRCIVEVRLPALFQQLKNGDVIRNTVKMILSVKLNAGSFVVVKDWTIHGKCVSDYIEGAEFTLPKSSTPETDEWQVKLERVTTDNEGNSKIANETWFHALTEIVTRRFRYPNMQISALEADAQNFSRIPTRTWHVEMKLIQIPTNYDPVTRTYATTGPGTTNGGWDGTFKIEYSNNPAWVIRDLSLNKNYGLGAHLSALRIDKWTLYEIAKYCDTMVPDGNGGQEPLFACNVYIQTQEQALKVLSDFCSIARVMMYWGNGLLNFVQDRPKTSFLQVTNSDVKEGTFSYSSTGRRARKSVAHVRYNDINDFCRPKIQTYEDFESIYRYGYNVVEVTAFGTTSRGQAYRFGALTIATEKYEYDVVSFTLCVNGMLVRPGMILDYMDEKRQLMEAGGRVLSTANLSSVTLDKPFTIEAGKSYKLRLVVPKALSEPSDITDSTQTASMETSQIEERTVTTGVGAQTTLTVSAPFSAVPVGAIWIVTSNTLAVQKCRVISVERVSNTEYQVVGNKYDERKFTESLVDPQFDATPIINYPTTGVVPPVSALTFKRRTVVTPAAVRSFLDIGWSNDSSYSFYAGYRVSWSLDGGPYTQLTEVQAPGHTFEMNVPGRYYVRVVAVGTLGGVSVPRQGYFDFASTNPTAGFTITGLELSGQADNYIFNGKDARFSWRLNSPSIAQEVGDETAGAQDGIKDPLFNFFRVKIFDNNGNLVYTERTSNPFFTYTYEMNSNNKFAADPLSIPPFRSFSIEVTAVDRYNEESDPASISVTNPAPALPSAVVESFLGAVQFKFSFPQDLDFRAFRIWASTSNGFTPSDANLVYDGPDTKPIVNLTAGVLHYYKYAAYDAFGITGINISPQGSVTPLLTLDTLPPAVPTLSATSYRTTRGDGTEIIKIRLTWPANTEPDMAGYIIAARETLGLDFTYFSVAGKDSTTFEVEVKANTSYQFKIRSYDKDRNNSEWSATVSITSTKDTTPPAKPIWGTCFASFRNIYYTWTKATETDFAFYELRVGDTSTYASSVIVAARVPSNTYVYHLPLTGELTGTTKYAWLVAYDTSGNASVPSDPVAVTIGGLAAPVITDPIATETITAADGTQKTYLNIVWTATIPTEFAGFEVEVSTITGQGNYLRQTVSNSAATTLKVEVLAATTYYVRMRVKDSNNGYSIWSTERVVASAADTTPPDNPTGFAVVSSMRAAVLSWQFPTAKDFNNVWIWRYTVSGTPVGDPTYTIAADTVFVDSNVTAGNTYFWRIKFRDRSGNLSAFSSEVTTTVGSIQAADIGDFAVGLTKRFNATVVPQNAAWSNNAPSAGHIAWNSHSLYYQGAVYTISAGDTSALAANKAYVYWDASSPTVYQISATNPTLTASQFMIATNVNGAHDLAWNGLANAVIGSAYIEDLAVTNAKIENLQVDKLTSGTITAKSFTLAAGGPVNALIKSSNWDGVLNVNNVVTTPGSAGFIFTSDGYGELSNVKIRGDILAGTISIGSNAFRVDTLGRMWSGAAAFENAPFRVDAAGNLTATSASISGVITARALEAGYFIVVGGAANASTSSIQSYNYGVGTGWRILGSGSAEFSDITLTGGSIGGSTITDVTSGATKARNALDASNRLTTAVIPTTAIAPSGSGLYLGSNYLGYYSGGWKTFMNNAGDFFLGGTGGALRFYGGSGVLRVEGEMHITAGSTINGEPSEDFVDGVARALEGLDNAGQLVKAAIPTSPVGNAPATNGLKLGSDYMGYYNAGWKTYLDNAGNFYFKSGSNQLVWNGTSLACSSGVAAFKGTNTSFWLGADGTFSIKDQFYFDGTDVFFKGKVDAGGLIITSATGLRYKDNAGVFTITGGGANGHSNGAQIDFAGNSAGANAGALVLAAGSTGTGWIHFRTSNTLQALMKENGDIEFYKNLKALTLASTSARKYKHNIRDLHNALDIIKASTSRYFDWNDGRLVNDVGFIADELETVLPAAVQRDSNGAPVAIEYGKLTAVLFAAVKELSAKIDRISHGL